MKKINVRLTFTNEVLGTATNDLDIYRKYIAGNAPDEGKVEEETHSLEAADESGKASMTVFSRDENGNPIFWDYQIRGFFKDACSALSKCKGAEEAKHSCSIKAYKKVIDGCIFVEPRQIPIDLHGGKMGICSRPLRAQTMQGERVALATSETCPAGSTIDFTVICINDDHEKAVIEWLEYAKFKCLGQWRNSGKGTARYEILD